MTLYEDFFGKTFGGWDKDLQFKPHVAYYKSIAIENSSIAIQLVGDVAVASVFLETIHVIEGWKAYAEFANNLRITEIGTAEDPGS